MTHGVVIWDSLPHDDHSGIVLKESDESIPSDDDEIDDELMDNSGDVEDEEDEEDEDEDLADPA